MGSTAAAAIQSLINQGFSVKVDGKSYYEDVTFAKVIGQSVKPGEYITKGSTVVLYFDGIDEDDANGWWTHDDEELLG